MSIVIAQRGRTKRRNEGIPVFCRGRTLRLMRLTDFVSEFSTCLGVPLANVTTWPGSETAYLLVDWEDMVEPLIGIGRNLAFGRKWLPLVAGSRVPAPIDEGDSMAGCALVSIRLSARSYGRTLGVWNGTAEADPDGCLSG